MMTSLASLSGLLGSKENPSADDGLAKDTVRQSLSNCERTGLTQLKVAHTFGNGSFPREVAILPMSFHRPRCSLSRS